MLTIAVFLLIVLIPCALLLAFSYFIDWWYFGRHKCADLTTFCGDCLDWKQRDRILNLHGEPFTK